jgi:hypothetical protein
MLSPHSMIYVLYLHLLGVLLRTVLAAICILVAARLAFDAWGSSPDTRTHCTRRSSK